MQGFQLLEEEWALIQHLEDILDIYVKARNTPHSPTATIQQPINIHGKCLVSEILYFTIYY